MAAMASTHRPVASREGFNQSSIEWMRGNARAQWHTGRGRSSRNGNLDVIMAVFPWPFVARAWNGERRGSRPGLCVGCAGSTHCRSDPHTGDPIRTRESQAAALLRRLTQRLASAAQGTTW